MQDTPSLFVIDESVRDPKADIWFAEPAGFTVIPLNTLLNLSDGTGSGSVRAALGRILDTAPDELARQLLVAHVESAQQMLVMLCELGTVYCAIGLHRDDSETGDGALPGSHGDARGCGAEAGGTGGALLLSFLTLSWRDIAIAPPSVTAARATSSCEGDEPLYVEYIENAPCGPVSLTETVRTPMAASGRGLAVAPLLQIHAHLPHPDGERLAVMTLSTQAVHRREDYRRILRGGVELVSFDDPLTGTGGRPVRGGAAPSGD
ncbi:hypothetical protein [Streptomyces sp. NPDC058308]|uniref:hypothetical protein n=1 Tax=Streptomyces sp. NPDC058308 TaxID=3346440 RepID=UPI0036EF47C5